MQIEKSISLLAYKGNPILAKEYVKRNGIKNAFVFREDKNLWEVLEGDSAQLSGFKAASFTLKREADAMAKEINAILLSLS